MFGMILFCIVVIFSLYCGIKDAVEVSFKEGVKTFIPCFIVCFVISAVVFSIVFGSASDCTMINSEYVGDKIPIKGLQYKTTSDTIIEGTFILGCGGFSSKGKVENTYYFFEVSDYGAKLESLDTSKCNVYINETDDEEPNVKTIYNKKYFDGFWEKMFGRCDTDEEIGKIITVPTNTIKVEYNVDIGK